MVEYYEKKNKVKLVKLQNIRQTENSGEFQVLL